MTCKGIQRLLALTCVLLATLAGAEDQQLISETDMALQYYQPLAEQGGAYAQLTIGEIYMEGAGVGQNLIQAYAWFAVALHQGVGEAESVINRLLDQLSAPEQAQARALAEQYIEHYSQ